MRTNVTLDSHLIKEVQVLTGEKTKAKAVVLALSEFLRWHKIRQIKNFRGKFHFRPDTATARHRDR